MTKHTAKSENASPLLVKPDPHAPALRATGRDSVVIKAGVSFAGHLFAEDTPVPLHLTATGEPGYLSGTDYVVGVIDGAVGVSQATGIPTADHILGGFHYAPGGNAASRAGGDGIPAINAFSLWDVAFRPACPDPRGMTLVTLPGRQFWCDIYLTGANHLADGTSKFGVTIADGDDCPLDAAGSKAKRFDYATARAVMASHGKGLLSLEEFFAAAFGVTEKTAAAHDPKVTGLDAPRTSRCGLMQATGNLWIWGHDGDPDEPRASIFGGSWFNVGDAGSRYAPVDYWDDNSDGDLGARGRSDHLQLA